MASSRVLRSVAASFGALYRPTNPLRSVSVAPNVALYRPTNPLRVAFVAPNVTRSFNTSSEMRLSDDDESDVQVDVKGSSVSPLRSLACGLFEGVYDPEWPPTRGLSKLLNLRMEAAGSRTAWDVEADDNVLSLRMDMPGLSRKDVKVSVEQNTLMIKGGDEKESEKGRRRYSGKMDLPPNLFKHGEIKAEMKNGVLKVVVAKVKEEEKKDVLQVKIE